MVVLGGGDSFFMSKVPLWVPQTARVVKPFVSFTHFHRGTSLIRNSAPPMTLQ